MTLSNRKCHFCAKGKSREHFARKCASVIFACLRVVLLRSDIMLRIVILPFGQLVSAAHLHKLSLYRPGKGSILFYYSE